MIWNKPRHFCQKNANPKCRGCARLWQNQLHHITESTAINAACVLMCDTCLLEAILLTRIKSSTDITSQQKQNSSQHKSVKLARKMSETAWLATIWQKHCIKTTCFKLPWHCPFVLHRFRKAYVLFHLLLLFTLYILIVNANADTSVITAFYSVLIVVIWRFYWLPSQALLSSRKSTCNNAAFSEHHASVDWCGLLHSLILNIAQAVM